MNSRLPSTLKLTSTKVIEELKENVTLIQYGNEKLILKGKREKERNFFEKLRFLNEKRIYKAFSENQCKNLNIPDHSLEEETGNLILEYIPSKKGENVLPAKFIKSYLELQNLNPSKHFFLDTYNIIFRGYFYRVFLVSLKTIIKKKSLKSALEAISLYMSLNLSQKKFNRKFWIHGDLKNNNFFYDESDDLYFIDFENMFSTRKWCMAEIIGRSFKFIEMDSEIKFNKNLVIEYLKQSNINSDRNFSLNLQLRFGLLHHSIHQIAQTRSKSKRKAYIELLEITLDKKRFQNYIHQNFRVALDY